MSFRGVAFRKERPQGTVISVCCQVQVSATSRSLVQSSLTECGVSECDIESLIMRRSWPTVRAVPPR